MVIERPQATAINYLPRFINDVNPLRPAAVGAVRGIIHRINGDGQRKMKTRHKIIGDSDALHERGRLRIADVLGDIGFHLPFVLRMRFADVNGQKIRAIFVVVVNLDEISDLAPERRSSVTAENEHKRTLADAVPQMEIGFPVERNQPRIRRLLSKLHVALAPVRQGVTQKSINVARPAHEMRQQKIRSDQQYGHRAEYPLPYRAFANFAVFTHKETRFSTDSPRAQAAPGKSPRARVPARECPRADYLPLRQYHPLCRWQSRPNRRARASPRLP